MFNFLQRTPKASPVIQISPTPADPSSPPPESGLINGGATEHPANDSGRAQTGIFDGKNLDGKNLDDKTFSGKTSASFTPVPGMFGQDAARAALAAVAKSKPRSIIFVAAPRTQGHAHAVLALLAGQAQALPSSDAAAAVASFDDRQTVTILRLPAASAKTFSQGVAEAIEMLSVTLPAAFDSDSYKVARLALEEELRSGHDTAIDALKRRALAQNIGLLRTPLGFAVAPMHEGRVVAPDVFKALPEGLKAGVEAKLIAFENELAGVLDNRTTLQQDHRTRLRDLDTDVASLTVRAALAALAKTFAALPAVAAWLEALSGDLVRNAALFVSAHRNANGHARAPVEIAQDPLLARYRVNILTHQTGGQSGGPGLVMPHDLERASLCGVIHLPPPGTALAPCAVIPGALASIGGGLLVIEARELMAEFGAWPLIKQALAAGHALPVDAASTNARPSSVPIPTDARIIVTGDLEDYRAFREADSEGTRTVRLITAFEPSIPLSRESEREFAGLVAAIVAEESLQPVDGAAMAALMHDRTQPDAATAVIATDLDPVRAVLILADQAARSSARAVTHAQDMLAALKQHADLAEPLAFAQAPIAPIIPEVLK